MKVILHEHPSIPRLYATRDGRLFVELTHSPDGRGYPLVRVNGRLVRRHTVVAETFLGPRPHGHVVRHKNGMPGDDRPGNLRWGSQAENCADTVAHQRSTRGEQNARHKLTATQASAIKSRRASGESGRSLAREFCISEQTIADIHHGRTWSWLEAR